MDPLSIIASSIGVAHVLKRSIGFLIKHFRANGELEALNNEISDLRVVLGELQTLLHQRAVSQNPLYPSANLIRCVNSIQSRLEAIEKEVQTWKDAVCLSRDVSSMKLFKALRISQKATSFKEELKGVRSHLWSMFATLSMSSSSRIEVDLKQILLLSEQYEARQEQMQTDLARLIEFHENRFPDGNENAMQRSGQREDGTIMENDPDAIPTSPTESNATGMAAVKAFRANGPVLLESSQMTAVSAIGIRVAQFPRMPCTPWCSCICHVERQQKTPSFLNQVLGKLFVGYSGLPFVSRECDQASCHLRARPYLHSTYIFPRWFLARAVSIVMTSTPLAGPVFSLRVHRSVPANAEIFSHARRGNVDRIKELFQTGLASPFDVQYDSGVTALHYATNYQHYNVCALLLQCNADPFWEDHSGVAAVDNAWGKIISRSMSSTNETAFRSMFSETECLERREFTVIHKIVVGLVPNDLEQALSASTAKINQGDSNGRTPLSFAAQRGDSSAVSVLLRYGADARKASNCGNSPLHHAAIATNLSCIDVLLSGNADPNGLTKWNQSPLHFVAAYTDDPERVRILVSYHADVEIRDLDGTTALDVAAISGNALVARELLNHGANVVNESKHGDVTLSQAVLANRHDVLRLFFEEPTRTILNNGLDTRARGIVLETAAKFGDLTTLNILSCALLDFSEASFSRGGEPNALIDLVSRRGDSSPDLQRAFVSIIGMPHNNAQSLYAADEEEQEDDWEDAHEYPGSD